MISRLQYFGPQVISFLRWLFALILFLGSGFLAYPQAHPDYIAQAEFALGQGNVSEAMDLLNTSIEIEPGRKRAYYLRGMAKYQLNDMVGAEIDLSIDLNANPRHKDAYIYRAESRFSLKKFNEGFLDLEAALSLDSSDIRIYTRMAVANLRLERNDRTLSSCNAGLVIDSDNVMLLLIRGETKADMGLFRVAIDDFELALKAEPENLRPRINMGMAYTGLQEFEKALAAFQVVFDEDEDNALALFQRARTYIDMRRNDDALHDLNRVLELFPNNSMSYFNRAIIRSNQKKWDEALADYSKVIVLNPTNILAHYNRGLIYLQKKNTGLAEKDLLRTISLFPDFLDAHETLSQLYRGQKKRKLYDREIAEIEAINSRNWQNNEQLKYQQKMQLMRLTSFKGAFESAPEVTGKKQKPEVVLDLQNSFHFSLFPEENQGFSAYDGWKKDVAFNKILILLNSPEKASDSVIVAAFQKFTAMELNAQNIWKIGVLTCGSAKYVALELLYSRSIEMKPSQIPAHFSLAQLRHEHLEKMESAITAKYFGNTPTPSYANFLSVSDSIYNLIISGYKKVIQTDPEFAFAAYNLANVLAETKEFDQAISFYSDAIEHRPEFAEAYFNRGLILLLQDKTTASCEDLSRAGQLGLKDAYELIKRYCE